MAHQEPSLRNEASVPPSNPFHEPHFSPTDNLPTETLWEIFMHCLPVSPQSISPTIAPLLLMQVCRRWREIAISLRYLWTELFLGDNLREEPRLAIEMWLSKSHDLPLNVTSSSMRWRESPNKRPAINCLIDSFHRFRRFHATLDAYWELSRRAFPIHAPLLESFAISTNDYFSIPSSIGRYYCRMDAPHLTSISLKHTPMLDLVSFESLRSISLDPLLLSDTMTLDFLRSCNRLTHLKIGIGGGGITQFMVAMNPFQMTGPVFHFQFLESFTIELWSAFDPSLFFQTISAPMLQTLTIRPKRSTFTTGFSFTTALHAFLGQQPALQVLDLQYVNLGGPVQFELARFGNLRSLTLLHCVIENHIIDSLTPSDTTVSTPGSWVCPRLAILRLDRKWCKESSYERLIQLRPAIETRETDEV